MEHLSFLADASGTITNSVKAVCVDSCETGLTVPNLIHNIANVLIYLVGAISVVMLILGGLRYVISGGDAAQTKQAKNTILYAVVGIVVAIVSFAVVNFVVSSITSNSSPAANKSNPIKNKPMVPPGP